MGLSQSIKLLTEHSRIVTGTTTANWNSGVATSGQPGADLVTIGTANRWMRLDEIFLLIFPAFNVAATVSIRGYMEMMGSNRLIGTPVTYACDGTDGEVALFSWLWEVEILGPVRVEVFSDQAVDDGFTATWEYWIKNW